MGRFHAVPRSRHGPGDGNQELESRLVFVHRRLHRLSPGMLMIWFMNAYDYRIVIGGKPMFSPFYSFPPSYELTILFGSFGALLGMLFLNRLPHLHHPLLKNRRFALATHDRFFVVIESSDAKFSDYETRRLLESLGSRHIELVEE